MTPEVDMVPRKMPDGASEVSRRSFTHRGLEVEEILWRWPRDSSPDNHKMVWCLAPFEQVHTQGRLNPLVHRDYLVPCTAAALEVVEAIVRRSVKEKFDQHHALGNNAPAPPNPQGG